MATAVVAYELLRGFEGAIEAALAGLVSPSQIKIFKRFTNREGILERDLSERADTIQFPGIEIVYIGVPVPKEGQMTNAEEVYTHQIGVLYVDSHLGSGTGTGASYPDSAADLSGTGTADVVAEIPQYLNIEQRLRRTLCYNENLVQSRIALLETQGKAANDFCIEKIMLRSGTLINEPKFDARGIWALLQVYEIDVREESTVQTAFNYQVS